MKITAKVYTGMALVLLAMVATSCLNPVRRGYASLWEQPISFEQGFSFTNSFTVPFADRYEVQVAFQRTNPHQSVREAMNELPIQFTVTCDGTTVAEGDSPRRLGTTCSVAEDTRVVARFQAEPGKTYRIVFRVSSALPSVAANKPIVRLRAVRKSSWL